MEYIDINRVVCSESEPMKWAISKSCNLLSLDGKAIVYDYSIQEYRYQSKDKLSWNTYLASIGNLKLSPYQKINSEGDIVSKTIDELYEDSLLTVEDYKQAKINEIKSAFDAACIKDGIALQGVFTMVSGVTVNNPKFQYDFDSINKLESVVSDARVGYWRSIDNKNIVLTNQDKQTLLELLKVTYFTKFAESRAAIDNL